MPNDTPISDSLRELMKTALGDIPPGKKAALIVAADADGNAHAQLAANYGDHFKLAEGVAYKLGEKRPKGYVQAELVW